MNADALRLGERELVHAVADLRGKVEQRKHDELSSAVVENFRAVDVAVGLYERAAVLRVKASFTQFRSRAPFVVSAVGQDSEKSTAFALEIKSFSLSAFLNREAICSRSLWACMQSRSVGKPSGSTPE